MNCERARRLLSMVHDGCPAGPEMQAITLHLRDCPGCRHFQGTLTAFEGGLRELEEGQPGPSPTVGDRALERWSAAREGTRWPFPPLLRLPLAPGVALGAALALALLAGRSLAPHRPVMTARPQSVPGNAPEHHAPGSGHQGERRRVVRPSVPPHQLTGEETLVNSPDEQAKTLPGVHREETREPHPRPRVHGRQRNLQHQIAGVDDLTYVNGNPGEAVRRWASLRADEWETFEARVRRSIHVRDDFVHIPFPRLAATSNRQVVEAVENYRREAAVVDARLAREVTLAEKGTALSDLCRRLSGSTAIELTAGPSVADEKATVLCRHLPVRDVMRQLSRCFGYTWLRSGTQGEYRYELVQGLRAQQWEEALRNQDRNAALRALDREVERYRPYLGLSPDAVFTRARTAPPGKKRLLEKLAGWGWGPIQIYSRLTPQDLAALEAGQKLEFSGAPRYGERPMPRDVEHGVLEALRDVRLFRREDHQLWLTSDLTDPRGLPLTAVPEAHALVRLEMPESELGHFTLIGYSGLTAGAGSSPDIHGLTSGGPLAIGTSPLVLGPENHGASARFAGDLVLQSRVTIRPQLPAPPPLPVLSTADADPTPGSGTAPRVTSAEVLEAIYRATRLPIIGDYYTRLYPAAAISVTKQSLYTSLDRLASVMRLRWNMDAGWLQFRSATYYDDRLKEVPNRLLSRWAAERRAHGSLRLDDLLEIAQLSDAQLDASDMAESVKALFGLAEWDLARNKVQRAHLRYLAEFTPEQRQEMMSARGLPFTSMSLAQQQQFMALGLGGLDEPLRSPAELAGATLRVEYTQPGWFEWRMPGASGYTEWVVPLEPGPEGRRVPRPPVLEKTRETALQALRRVDPRLREALWQAVRRSDPRRGPDPPPDEAQIAPTRLNLTIIYIPSATNKRHLHVLFGDNEVDWAEG